MKVAVLQEVVVWHTYIVEISDDVDLSGDDDGEAVYQAVFAASTDCWQHDPDLDDEDDDVATLSISLLNDDGDPKDLPIWERAPE
jgi:hypothetical protein